VVFIHIKKCITFSKFNLTIKYMNMCLIRKKKRRAQKMKKIFNNMMMIGYKKKKTSLSFKTRERYL